MVMQVTLDNKQVGLQRAGLRALIVAVVFLDAMFCCCAAKHQNDVLVVTEHGLSETSPAAGSFTVELFRKTSTQKVGLNVTFTKDSCLNVSR